MGTQDDTASSSPASEPRTDSGDGLRGRLSSLLRGSEKVVDRIAGSVKEVGRSHLLRQALDAKERGNLAAAFWLLDEEFRNQPASEEVARSFWDVAVEYGRAADAVGAIEYLIAGCAQADHRELACQYWAELVGQLPDALVNAQSLGKILRPLEQAVDGERDEGARELRRYVLIKATQAMVHESNEGLTPGMAFRLAETARQFDPRSAIAAAKVALRSESLHEAKREHLMEILSGEMVDTRAAAPGARLQDPEDAVDPETTRSSRDESSQPQGALPKPVEAKAVRSCRGRRAVEGHPLWEEHPLWSDDGTSPSLSEEEVERARARLSRVAQSSPPSADGVEPALSSPEATEDEREQSDVMEVEPVDLLEASQHSAIAREADPPRIPPEGARFRDAKILRGTIAQFSEDEVSFSVAHGKKSRVAYDWVQAVAVAEIGDSPGLTIDLLLNWSEQEQDSLRSVRLHADSFSAHVPTSEEGDAPMELRDVLAEILDRSRAVPLPDPDSVLGISARRYDSIEAYEREVLQLVR